MISGRVIDAETGDAVDNAIVSIPARARGTLSRSDGSFDLGGVPAGVQVLRIQRIGYQDAVVAIEVVEGSPPLVVRLRTAPVPVEGLEVTVQGGADVTGRVVDGSSGAPMADVLVWSATDEDGVTTDSAGVFRFPRVPLGPGLLQVESVGFGRRYVPIQVAAGSPPVEITLMPDSAALRGLPAVEYRLRGRRNAYLGIVRAFDERRLRFTGVENARLVVADFTFAHVVACQGMARSHWCVDVNGTPTEPNVCIDGAPALGGLDDLQTISPHELYLLEVYGTEGLSVRAYTFAYMEEMARSTASPVMDEPSPQREGIDGLGWASTRGPASVRGWTGPRC